MVNSKLDDSIAYENERLNKLLKKRDELDRKIKESKTKIEKYSLLKNNQQFIILSDSLVTAGVNFDEIITALSSGNLYTLQHKIESSKSNSSTVVSGSSFK